MPRNAAVPPILLLIASSSVQILARLGIRLWEAFVINSSTPFDILKAGHLFFSTVPGYLMILLSALALGIAANSLRMQKFEDKSAGVAITALTTIAFIQAFTTVFRVF